MTTSRLHILLIIVACVPMAAAQNPTDPTSCTTGDLPQGATPDCQAALSTWPIFGCDRATVLGMVPATATPAQAPFTYVTGLTDPDSGREFALLCCDAGLLVVDAHTIWSPTGPTATVPQSWWLPDGVPSGGYRGAVAFGRYIYEGSTFRPDIRIFEVEVGTASCPTVCVTPRGSFAINNPGPYPGSSYRLTVDAERKHLYVTGSVLRIYSLATPTNPTPLAYWSGLGSTTMQAFDVHLFKDGSSTRAVVSEYLGQHTAVLDVSVLPSGSPGPIVNWQPPFWCAWVGPTQNAWMSPDGELLYCSMGNYNTRVYKVGDVDYSANSIIGEPTLLPHVYSQVPNRHHLSLQGLGYTGYASSFQDGVLLYDLRPGIVDPDEILARVDTSICDAADTVSAPCTFPHEGNFAVYRHQDSGVLYVSDRTNGLYFVRANVGHVHRFGKGSPEMVAGVPRIPRITLEAAPPRVAAPGTDNHLAVTISNLAPNRDCVVNFHTEGRNTPIPYPQAPNFDQWGGGWLVNSVICGPSSANGVITFTISTAGIPDQFRLFLQAYSYQNTTCVASSRGTWFGFAAAQ